MTETQRRIKAYQELLPSLRERVIAVAILLAMSASMLSSASFAWLTISRNPEVTNISTNIAANGNLEVALASGDGSQAPGESAVGDSAAATGQSVVGANVTWGNLINLADPSYGLEHLTLRPAELNTADLLYAPLNAAVYKKDGRVSGLANNFAYTSWVEPEVEGTQGYFGEATGLGVRGISSVKREVTAYTETADSYRANAVTANSEAARMYTGITTAENGRWMEVLARMMGVHMSATLNSEDKYKNAVVSRDDLNDLISMYDAFVDAYEKEAEALASQLNWQLYLAHGGNTNAYTPWTADMIFTTATVKQADLNTGGKYAGRDDIAVGDLVVESFTDNSGKVKTVMFSKIKTFQDDYKMLSTSVAKMENIRDNTERRWTADGLVTIINQLVNIDKCYVQKGSEPARLVSDLMKEFTGNGMSGYLSAMDWMNKDVNAIITNGVLYNFDQLTGAGIQVTRINGEGLQIQATVDLKGTPINANLYATIYTSATTPCDFSNSVTSKRQQELDSGASTDSDAGDMIAQDTYGLAIDLWVRTNAENAYLTLEGNVLYSTEIVPKMVTNLNGTQSQLHTMSRTEKVYKLDENGEVVLDANGDPVLEDLTTMVELYKIETEDANGNPVTTWYTNGNHVEFTLLEGENPTPRTEEVNTPIGYQGANRVWDENVVQSVDATTQGSGSCYIYYAQTPEDQARSMELLKAMHVAFIDANGKLLADSAMDTENSFEDGGRIIVPLALDARATAVSVGDKTVRTITKLKQNEPTRITAIVYLDGTVLTNDNVLAAGDIQGQLNIQFGSSQTLTPVRNLKLEGEERTVTATVTNSSFDYENHQGDMTTRVNVTVNGDQPNNMRGFFLRQINATQGTPEGVIQFTLDPATNTWVGDYTFTSPGTYVLRSVQMDGQEKALKEPLPTVNISGFGIRTLSWDEGVSNRATVMTADSTYSTDLTLKFGGQRQPGTVEGRFVREDGNVVSVNFTYDTTSDLWTGTAVFRSSGVYTLSMLVVDGDYIEIPTSTETTVNMQKTMDIKLGMYATIESVDGINAPFLYLPDQMTEAQKNIDLDVDLFDNTGKAMMGLQNVKLYYRNQASAVRVMDTDLTWNAARNSYVGALKTLEGGGPGTWIFSRVTIGGTSTITRAASAPAFTMISPNEPGYVGVTDAQLAEKLKIAPNGGVTMEVKLKDSETATVAALISGHEVQGKLAGEDENGNQIWSFEIPTEAHSQSGTWTLSEVRVWNFYKKDGTFVNADLLEGSTLLDPDGQRDAPLTFKVDGYTKTVIHTLNVTVSASGTESVDGVTTRKFSGSFMQPHDFDGLKVTIANADGNPLPAEAPVENVKISYSYDGDASSKGYYQAATGTSTSKADNGSAFTMNLNWIHYTGASTSGDYYQSETKTLRVAGTYRPYQLTFSVGGVVYTYGAASAEMNNKVPVVVISSEKPTVKISDITMDDLGVYSVDEADSLNDPYTTEQKSGGCFTDYTHTFHTHEDHKAGQYKSSLSADGMTAILYFKCSHTDAATYGVHQRNGVSTADYSYCEYHKYSTAGNGTDIPMATMSLTGKGYASSAYLPFTRDGGGNVVLLADYANTAATTDRFTWTADGGCNRYVGAWNPGKGNGSTGSDTKTVTGTIKANTLMLVYDGVEYKVTVPTVTINNPY